MLGMPVVSVPILGDANLSWSWPHICIRRLSAFAAVAATTDDDDDDDDACRDSAVDYMPVGIDVRLSRMLTS